MKVVHICLASFFPDNYSYQENMMPKFHKQQGLDVEVIASLKTFDSNGVTTYYKAARQYINENNILVTRIDYKKPTKIYKVLRRYIGTLKALERSKPDYLFIHGFQFLDIDQVIKYIRKNPNVIVYVDSHADYSNSATNWLSKNILNGFIWAQCAKKIYPYARKIYGVLPARVDFLHEVYKLPKEKCELLVMGADDDMVKDAADPIKMCQLRKKHGIRENDFLIVTGGKIDKFKKQILLLMDAVISMNNSSIKLIVFGSVTPDLKDEVIQRTEGKRVQFIGWVDSKESYYYFSIADLVVFPGRHSVFWEQVVAQGKPMVCKKWEGTTHIDLGGNVIFLNNDSSEEIKEILERLYNTPQELKDMRKVATEKGMKVFSYKDISMRGIGLKS